MLIDMGGSEAIQDEQVGRNQGTANRTAQVLPKRAYTNAVSYDTLYRKLTTGLAVGFRATCLSGRIGTTYFEINAST